MKYIKLSFSAKNKNFNYPFFIGSMLRGTLGYGLKDVVCINPSFQCSKCFTKQTCLFYEFYEEKNSFHKFRFDFELNLKNLDFSIYLFDNKINDISSILMALKNMLEKNGLGKDREKFEILKVQFNDKDIFINNQFNLDNCQPLELKDGNYSKNIKLKFITPLRIKENNNFARRDIKLETILKSIKYRLSQLKNLDDRRLNFIPTYDIQKKDILFSDFQRYSNRQDTKMNIGGLIGEIEYHNLDKDSYNLLKIGEIIGVGKSTVFGLGKIKLEELNNECN